MDNFKRKARHRRIRTRVSGTATRPRISLYRSNQSLSAQVIDDTKGHTLAAARAATPAEVAANIVDQLKKQNIAAAAFDRGGYAYHGRVKQFAEALREAGINL